MNMANSVHFAQTIHKTAEALELLAFNIRLSKYYKRQKAEDSKEK